MRGNLENLIHFLKNEPLCIELKQFNFILPVFLLGILCAKSYKDIRVISNGEIPEISNYLNRLNFYTLLGIHVKPIQKYSSLNFLEITKIDDTLTDEKIEEFRRKISDKLGISISKKDESKAYSVNFFLAELIRNVTNHAFLEKVSGEAFFMFQTYPSKKILNISIADSGIGIQESFRGTEYWDHKKSIEYYIQLAFQRGRTSNPENGAGNGLYFSKELIKVTNSELHYMSGNVLFTIINGKEEYSIIDDFYRRGVLIDLEINIDNINSQKVKDLFQGVYPGYIEEYDSLDDIFT